MVNCDAFLDEQESIGARAIAEIRAAAAGKETASREQALAELQQAVGVMIPEVNCEDSSAWIDYKEQQLSPGGPQHLIVLHSPQRTPIAILMRWSDVGGWELDAWERSRPGRQPRHCSYAVMPDSEAPPHVWRYCTQLCFALALAKELATTGEPKGEEY